MKHGLSRAILASAMVALLCSASANPSAAQQSPATSNAGSTPQPSAAARRQGLRPGWQYLANSDDRLELRGRSDQVEFDLHVAEPADGRIIIGYQTSDNLLGDESDLVLSVNGRRLASARLKAVDAGEVARWHIPISKGALRAGWNRVVVGADLLSNDACTAGPEAQPNVTIVPQSSIVDLPQGALSGRINPGPDGHLNVVLLQPGLADPENGSAALIAAQEIGRRLPQAAPYLDVKTTSGSSDADLWVALGDATGPREKTMSLVEFLESVPIHLDRRAEDSSMIEPNNRYKLADFGISTSSWSERYRAFEIEFDLPEDFYGMRTSIIRLNLRALIEEGLPADSRIDVYLNEIRAASALLAGRGSSQRQSWTIDLPMHEAHGGHNAIRFAVSIPPLDEEECLAGTLRDDEPLITLYEDSALTMTSFARASVASPMTTLSPQNGAPVQLVAPVGSVRVYTAAARLLAGVAARTGETREVRVTARAPKTGSALFIASAKNLDQRVLRRFGLSKQGLIVWQRQITNAFAQSLDSQQETGEDLTVSWLEDRFNALVRPESGRPLEFPRATDRAGLLSVRIGEHSQTLFVGSDHDELVEAATIVQTGVANALDAPAVAVEGDGSMRIQDTMQSARMTAYSIGNARLFAASFFSTYVWLYSGLVLLLACIVGVTSWVALNHKSKD